MDGDYIVTIMDMKKLVDILQTSDADNHLTTKTKTNSPTTLSKDFADYFTSFKQKTTIPTLDWTNA